MSHSLFSPSAAYRWTQCPGSVALARDVPSTSGEASREGTMLHKVMEKHLEKARPLETFDLTDEQCAACRACAGHVKSLPRQDTFYELKVCFGPAVGQPDAECTGTSDVIQVDGTTVRVIDYKFGRRYVDPTDNPQGILYMLGARETLAIAGYRFDSYEFEILQPRVGDDVSNGVFTLTSQELDDWAGKLKKDCERVKMALETYGGMPETTWRELFLRPSESACTFCPAAATCPELIAIATREAEDFCTDEFPLEEKVKATEPDDLACRLARLPVLKEYIRAVEEEAMRRLVSGVDVPGYMLVKGREGNREWKDKEEALLALAHLKLDRSDCMTQPDLMSPAQIQNRLVAMGMTKRNARQIIDDLTQRPPAKPTVVSTEKGGVPWEPEKGVINDFNGL